MWSDWQREVWRSWCTPLPGKVVALTGAGMSAESGIPTFRGAGGRWPQREAARLATPEAFAADPREVWRWYDERRCQAARARPHAGHLSLARMEALVERLTVITQNVDGLHQRAGSAHVLQLHGSLWRMRCLGCRVERDDRRVPLQPLPPRCRACGALLRPGVVWFGERLPERVLAQSSRVAQEADIMLVVGTSAQVQPAAGLPLWAARAGARVAEINPEETPLTEAVDLSLRGTAAALLPALVEVMEASASARNRPS